MISVVKALMSAMDTKVALHIANPFLMAAVILPATSRQSETFPDWKCILLE